MTSDQKDQLAANALAYACAFLMVCVGAALVWAAWSFLPPLLFSWWYYVLMVIGALVTIVVILYLVVGLSSMVTELRQNSQEATLSLSRQIESLDVATRQRFSQIEHQLHKLQKKTPPFIGALAIAAGVWQVIVTKLLAEQGSAVKEIAISAVLGFVFYWATVALESENRQHRKVGWGILAVWIAACLGLALMLVSRTAIIDFLSNLTSLDLVCIVVITLLVIVVPTLSCTFWREAK